MTEVLLPGTVDVSDRDARLAGRAKLLDSTGAVIDPALKGQLPAALVGGRLSVDASGVAVPITDNAGSLTVDGTVTGNQGTANTAANAWPAKLTDGTNTTAVKAASTAAVAGDPAAVVTIGPNTGLPTGTNTIGAVNQGPTAAATANAWPIKNTDGTNVAAVKAASTHAVAADPALVVAQRRPITYHAGYRLAVAASQLSLTFTFTANTDKQLATIHHLVGSTKTVRIRKISLVASTGALGVFGFDVRRLSAATAPATGNPAITPAAFDSSAAAAEAVTLALPTTAGSLAATDQILTPHVEWNSAAAAATANPSGLAGEEVVLYDGRALQDAQFPTLRSGTAEGLAIVGRCTTAVALRFTASIEFTEE